MPGEMSTTRAWNAIMMIAEEITNENLLRAMIDIRTKFMIEGVMIMVEMIEDTRVHPQEVEKSVIIASVALLDARTASTLLVTEVNQKRALFYRICHKVGLASGQKAGYREDHLQKEKLDPN